MRQSGGLSNSERGKPTEKGGAGRRMRSIRVNPTVSANSERKGLPLPFAIMTENGGYEQTTLYVKMTEKSSKPSADAAAQQSRPRRNTIKEVNKMTTVYDFTVKDRLNNEVNLGGYEGKVLLIVNTATGCGFTPHYDPLEEMYKDFRDQGFEILDFPCNQFADQAPGDAEEIHQFCTLKFGTEFPQFAKIDVNGEDALPLFAWLATEKPFAGFGKGLKNAALNKFADRNNKKFGDKAYIKWNFTKFLIDRKGNVIARFEPTTDMKDVRAAVAAELEK